MYLRGISLFLIVFATISENVCFKFVKEDNAQEDISSESKSKREYFTEILKKFQQKTKNLTEKHLQNLKIMPLLIEIRSRMKLYTDTFWQYFQCIPPLNEICSGMQIYLNTFCTRFWTHIKPLTIETLHGMKITTYRFFCIMEKFSKMGKNLFYPYEHEAEETIFEKLCNFWIISIIFHVILIILLVRNYFKRDSSLVDTLREGYTEEISYGQRESMDKNEQKDEPEVGELTVDIDDPEAISVITDDESNAEDLQENDKIVHDDSKREENEIKFNLSSNLSNLDDSFILLKLSVSENLEVQ
ncbi:uncharacterized protein LOC111619111 [Centruroides sculpturatus]|uniref:uncharacterized protein LOC111619111 n=1 Tax=Centruroides sculpturatus TaxID=218467 RepID=UPI000C6E34BF|nr:uncharacterized protein LOC111619111 [Centruroides sculpturatus]